MRRSYAPREIRQLPFNMMRSQSYPPAPWVLEEGAEQEFSGPPVTMLMPQRMMFTKYKTDPQGRTTTLAPSVVNVAKIYTETFARAHALSLVGVNAPQGLDIDTVSDPYNQLPTLAESEDYQEPISRGVLSRNDAQPGSRLDALAASIAADPLSVCRESYFLERPDGFLFPDNYVFKRG